MAAFPKKTQFSFIKSNILKIYRTLCNSRPTAINLKWALDEIIKVILKMPPEQRGLESMKIANKIRNDDINSCKQIGKYGLEVIKKIYKKKKKMCKHTDSL